jgi:hypothetical protein
MSALGQKLPRRGQTGMSALLPKAAAAVAKSHNRTHTLQQKSGLFYARKY